MNNRARYGINAHLINFLCGMRSRRLDVSRHNAVHCCRRSFDADLATSSAPAGWLDLAVANGMVVLLDPIETIDWLKMRANGP
jgi:hypothetical protein